MRVFCQSAPGDGHVIYGEDALHISRSLRARPGEKIILCHGGVEYDGEIRAVGAGTVTVGVRGGAPSKGEPRAAVRLFSGMPKGDRAELIVQKAVELGAAEICFFISGRCVAKPEGDAAKKRLSRLEKVAREAAAQSGRGRVPAVLGFWGFEEALGRGLAADMALFCYEGGGAPLSKTLSARPPDGISSVSVFCGPEGGFAPEEFDKAAGIGYNIVTLGARILRCETAPLCALSAIMFYFCEF